MSTEILWTGPETAPVVMLAHGAGAPMDSVWMNRFCELLADRSIRTARFEFGYMAARRSGVRRPPPKAETLVGEYVDAVHLVRAAVAGAVVIGGKSMGGRVASMAADDLYARGAVVGLCCLGYPFHPPGRPDRLRTAHLATLRTPTLICQGTRDSMGTRDEVEGYPLAPRTSVTWLEDGDHELRPRAKISGFSHEAHLNRAADAVAAFVAQV